jgi:hypothetical protein
VPLAYKELKEHGKDGLVVILTEAQAPSPTKAELLGFTLQNFHKYGNDDVFITFSDEPFKTDAPGLPHAALIGVDGKILILGDPRSWGKKGDEAFKEEFAKIKSGWGKSPEAKKARALMYGKNQLGEAYTTLAAADGKIKDDAKDDFAEARSEVDTKYAAMKDAVKILEERGHFADAKKAAENLQKAVKGRPEWESEVATIVADFAKPDAEKEIALDKAIAGIMKSIGDKKPTEDHEKHLKDLAKKNDGTKAAARAAELAAACTWKSPAIKDTKDKEGKDPSKDPKPPKDGAKPGG